MNDNPHDPKNLAWSRALCATISTGGSWAVPRSGLIFRKTGEREFTLAVALPFDAFDRTGFDGPGIGADVPRTEAALISWQQQDYRCIKRHLEAAGITVLSRVESIVDPEGLSS